MVHFEKDKYIIEVDAPSGMFDWQETFRALLRLVGSLNPEEVPDPTTLYHVCSLMEDMLPGDEDILHIMTQCGLRDAAK